MVAKSPPKQKKMAAPPLNSNLLRETVKKVDQCMARLQELQYTVSGGTKVISGVNLSPRSTRGYLRTSIRCKQESLRMKNSATTKKSPIGKFQGSTGASEWRQMSLPAMLVGETVGEILQVSQFAREVVDAVGFKTKKIIPDDPRTPISQRRGPKAQPENTEMKVRRKREKQVLQLIRSDSNSPCLQRARSRINFKLSPNKRDLGKENCYMANRVSPKHKPWAKKAVLFPNPMFHSSPSSHQQRFSKTRSPIIARPRQQSPHKFLIKSPPSNSRFQVKIKNPQVCLSPTRSMTTTLSKKSPHKFLIKSPPSNSKFQVKIKNPQVCVSPTRSMTTTLSKKSPKLSTAAKLRRSFSPSRLASRLVSPLKSRRTSMQQKSNGVMMSGLKQRPSSTPVPFSNWKQ